MSLYLGETPIAVNSSSREIGEIIQSTIPLSDAGLHLLDGALISGSGSYAKFVNYIADLHGTTSESFTAPTLTSNGELGGNSFAVYTNVPQDTRYGDAWGLFNTNWVFHSVQNSKIGDIIFYNPQPLNVTSISMTNQTSVNNRASSAGTIYGSNDGITWIEIKAYTNSIQTGSATWSIDLSNNVNYYKYYKINSTSGGSDSWWVIQQMSLTVTVMGIPDFFCTEAEWQQIVTTYGVCGKFVYDSENNTVRLPKITGFTEGTIDPTVLGDLVEAGLPNIEGMFKQAGQGDNESTLDGFTGAFYNATAFSGKYVTPTGTAGTGGAKAGFDASRSSSIYGKSSTVQPQSIKVLYYIVIATSTKTDIEVDIDEIATDLNGKADTDLSNLDATGQAIIGGKANTDLSNVNNTSNVAALNLNSKGIRTVVETYVNGASWYRIYSDGWCEQGGYIPTQTRNDDYPVTLLKPYINTNYSLITNKWIVTTVTSNLGAYSLRTRNKTTSSFTTAVDPNVACNWQACGYIS